MKNLSLLFICFMASLAYGQSNYQMFASMDGSMHLDPSGNTNIWGYGFIGDGNIRLPSPLLRIPKGNDVSIEMTNLSGEAHTIHLHGLDVDQANDGVPQTSFYIFPDEVGTYSFNANHEGTYLYHCHVTTTLHLTMGMYGMIVVDAPNNQVYEGGPVYDSSFQYLMSDLEIATNNFPLFAFPFHEIKPDYFMVNGDAGALLTGQIENVIEAAPGDNVLLNLGSMAYSKVKMIFPESFHASVLMSDGRVLPDEVAVTELEIYPGERFSVMLNPEVGFPDFVEVEFYSMVNNEYLSSDFIPVSDLSLNIPVENEPSFLVYPNPSSEFIQLNTDYSGPFQIINARGEIAMNSTVSAGNSINIGHIPSGSYTLKTENGLNLQFIKK